MPIFFLWFLPLCITHPIVLPAVVFSFGLLVLFTIHFKPKKFTFPFFSMTVNWVFGVEIILEKIGFISLETDGTFGILIHYIGFISGYLITLVIMSFLQNIKILFGLKQGLTGYYLD